MFPSVVPSSTRRFPSLFVSVRRKLVSFVTYASLDRSSFYVFLKFSKIAANHNSSPFFMVFMSKVT